MNSLSQIVQSIQRLGLTPPPLAGNMKRLYEIVKKQQVDDEDQVIRLLFPNSKRETARKNLWKIRTQLSDRLINGILVSDLEGRLTGVQKGFFRHTRRYATAKILLGLGLRQAAIMIAEKSIKWSIENQSTELAFGFSRILRDHNARIAGNKKKYVHFSQLSQQYFNFLQAEYVVEELFNELVFSFPKKAIVSKEKVAHAKLFPDRVKPFIDTHQCFRVQFVGFNITVLAYQIQSDHQQVIETCEQAIEALHSFPTYPTAAFNFIFRKIPSYLQLRQFDEAQQTIAECLRQTGSSTHNWLATQHYNALLGLHTENWDHVLRVFEVVNKRQKAIPEIWFIYEAYAHILKGNQDFRLGKFLNQVAKLSKEKQGMNINVRIIEILYHLLHEEHGKIIDKQDALREYSKRHLRKDQSTYRSDLFIRLLLLLPRYSFRSIGIEKAALPYLKKLKGNPLDMVLQDTDLEVVPFERLWEWVRERLT